MQTAQAVQLLFVAQCPPPSLGSVRAVAVWRGKLRLRLHFSSVDEATSQNKSMQNRQERVFMKNYLNILKTSQNTNFFLLSLQEIHINAIFAVRFQHKHKNDKLPLMMSIPNMAQE